MRSQTPLLLSLLALLPTSRAYELVFATAIFRHGDRTPIEPYPTDPYADSSLWPVHFGQLTRLGKQQEYDLGLFLKERYSEALNLSKYDDQKVYVRSTDVDRTLMSAQCVLAAFFPPTDSYEKFRDDLVWQPVPVHTVAADHDNLLSLHAVCPRRDELVSEVLHNDPVVKKLDEEHRELYDYLSLHSGKSVENMQQVDYIFDTLFIEHKYNMSLPPWTDQVFPDKMRLLKDLSFTLTTWNHQLKRLRSGPLIQSLLDDFKRASKAHIGKQESDKESDKDEKSDLWPRRLNLYSGHDTTLASLMNALDILEPVVAPPYSSCLLVELTMEQNDFFISFLYRNDTSKAPYQLTLPKCDFRCRLDDFERITSDLRPQNWHLECGLDPIVNVVILLSAIICTSLILALLIAVVTTIIKRRDRNSQYDPIKQEP